MGLFDPPTKSILKRVPVSAHDQLAMVQVLAEAVIPQDVGRTRHASLAAMAMALWVTAHARAGSFDLSQWNFNYCMNMYRNCASVAGPTVELLFPVMRKLIDEGFMPDGYAEAFAEDHPGW